MKHKKRILIVDDDASVASVTADIVRSFGYLAVTAWDEISALRIWKETHGAFDLLLIDYQLGGDSGARLAVQLGKEKPNLPVILISGWTEDKIDRPPSGRVAFLGKPFAVEELRSKIDTAFRKVERDLHPCPTTASRASRK